MYGRPYNGAHVVGQWGERTAKKIFGWESIGKNLLDMTFDCKAPDGSYVAEVKTSAYTNGGVINEKQLLRFREVAEKRFYLFIYHRINKDMHKRFATKKTLLHALDKNLKSIYLFPFSIVDAFYKNTSTIKAKKHDHFVQMEEKHADAIFHKNDQIWTLLGIDSAEYDAAQPYEHMGIMTRNGDLEERILDSLDLSKLR